MALERIEPGVFEPAELAIRESIVLPYIARQEALFLQTGYRFNDDSGPHETFSCIQQDIRTLYAEPAGKLALSEVLWQRGSIHPETGDITWEFRNPERGERLASRLESILGPADEPVLPHIEKVAQNEAAQNSRLKNSTATRIVRALQRVWTHYGALEEEYRAGQTNLPFIEYLLDSRASRIPEIWYLKWQKEERHTTMTYVPKAAPEAPAVDDQPEAEPEQIKIGVHAAARSRRDNQGYRRLTRAGGRSVTMLLFSMSRSPESPRI